MTDLYVFILIIQYSIFNKLYLLNCYISLEVFCYGIKKIKTILIIKKTFIIFDDLFLLA